MALSMEKIKTMIGFRLVLMHSSMLLSLSAVLFISLDVMIFCLLYTSREDMIRDGLFQVAGAEDLNQPLLEM